MTYGELKQKIYALLDADGAGEGIVGTAAHLLAPRLPEVINETARKTVRHMRSLTGTALVTMEKGAVGVQCALPEDAYAVLGIMRGGRMFGAESFLLVGRTLVFFGGGEGEYTLIMYIYPEALTEESFEGDALPYDDMTADAVAYGVAGALCGSLYPADLTRYMRFMTEYDERVSGMLTHSGESHLANRLFAKRG